MFNSLNKILKKAIIIFLITTLTYSNFVLIGTNVMKGFVSYALDEAEQKLEDKVITEQELITNTICEIKGEQKRVIQVAVTTGIEEEAYPIKETKIILETNIVEETLEDIKVTELNKNSYTTGTYRIMDEKMEITLSNENETLESKEKGLDKLLITYIFANNEENQITQIVKPLEQVMVKTYSDEVVIKTNEVSNCEDIEKNTDILLLNMENKDIHKTTITEGSVEYKEKLNLDLSYRKEIANIVIQDIANDFYNNEEEKVEQTLKYTKTKINKENLINLLGDEGTLAIKDLKTDKVLIEITEQYIEEQELNTKKEQNFIINEETNESEIRTYVTITEENVEIEYVIDVTNMNLELKNIKAQSEDTIELSNLTIENTKLIYNIQNVDNLNYLKENVKYVLDEVEKTAESKITFKDTITRATLETDKTELTIGEANKVNYVVTLDTESEKAELFVNPIFVIELPTSVTSVNRENSEFSVKNDNDVFTNNEVFISSLLGRQYAVILLNGEQTVETVANGNTQITLSLELNVAEDVSEGNETAKLYYQNSTVTAYESGAGFDTAEVDVELVLQIEEKKEIVEIEEDIRIKAYIDLPFEAIVKQGEQIEYKINIYNYEEQLLENVKVIDILPEGVSLEKVVELKLNETYGEGYEIYDKEEEIPYNYDANTRELQIEIEKMDAATKEEIINKETNEKILDIIKPSFKTLKVIVTADVLEENVYIKEIKNKATVKLGEETYLTNEINNFISDSFLVVETNSLENGIYENQDIVFELKVTNKGLIDTKQIQANIDFSEYLKLSSVEYGLLNENNEVISKTVGTISNKKYNQTLIEIPAGHTFYLIISGVIGESEETLEEINVTGSIDGQTFSWNAKVEQEINPENPTEPEEPIEPENPTEPEEPIEPDDPTAPEEPDEDEIVVGFDLSLNQYLNKITVENSQGTTTYDYTNTNFAKVEIPAKYMNGSKLTLEYKIIIKNEGTIPGYARKIVDYIPEGLKFNLEQNKDWYVADDGNIYSVALIDKILKPGDSKELTIVLTKEMNNNNTGTITNIVEIYEATNDENVEDVNSIPGDKLEEQNDISRVEVIVAVRTGIIILYIILAIIVITIIGLGIYRVKKIALDKKGGC